MSRRWWRQGVWITLPAEKRAEGEMLDHWEFGEHLGVVHFYHPLLSINGYYYAGWRI